MVHTVIADAIINDSSRNEDDEYSLQSAKRLKTDVPSRSEVGYYDDEPKRIKADIIDYSDDLPRMQRTKADIIGASFTAFTVN